MEKDDFWDISSLVPARKKTESVPTVRDTEAVEIRLNAPTLKGAAATDSLFVEHPVPLYRAQRKESEEALLVYQPQNALLREVRVYPWRTEYDYYEQFARHARVFYEKEGKECPAVDFFFLRTAICADERRTACLLSLVAAEFPRGEVPAGGALLSAFVRI